MKKTNTLIFILVAAIILICSGNLKSQPNTLYFMKGIPETKDINPARPGIESGFYVSMPLFSKLDLSANTNNWSYSDLIHWGTGQRADSLVVDMNKFMSSLGKSNFVMESVALTLFEGGFKSGKNFFAVSLSEKEFAEVYFHKNLVRLINYGNYPFLGSTFNSGTFGIGAQNYHELAFNFARVVDRKLTVGAAAKVLFGLGAIQTNGIKFRVGSPISGDSLNVVTTGKVNISAPVDFKYTKQGLVGSVTNNFNGKNYFTNFGNPGFAADLGFAYHVNKKFEFSMSIIDLGLITWNTNTTRLNENGSFLYKGIKIANPLSPTLPALQPLITQLGDSMQRAFRPDTSHHAFATLLPVKIYMGGDYQYSKTVSFSGLARMRIYNNHVHTSWTTSANVLIWNNISLSGSYSIMESTYDNLGVGIGFRGGPFQLYAATDNIISPFYPNTARNMNLRVGINLIFDDREKEKKGKNGKHLNSDCHCPN